MADNLLHWRRRLLFGSVSHHQPNFTIATFFLIVMLSALIVLSIEADNDFQQHHRNGRTSIAGSSVRNLITFFAKEKTPPEICFKQGDSKCFCWRRYRLRGQIANCSRNNGRLKFLPKIHRKILWYDFSFNKLGSISSDGFLLNVSSVGALDLSHNGLAYIHPGAFRVFKDLQQLFLNNNHLAYRDIAHIFPLSTLLHLKIGSTNLGPIPVDFFKNDSVPFLNALDLNTSTLWHLDFSAFKTLPKLNFLYARGCRLTDSMLTTYLMPELREINFADNAFFDLPQSCDHKKGTSLFPKLDSLVLLGNNLGSLPSNYCLPALTTLDLSSTRINRFTTDMFNKGGFPNLTRLMLNSIQPISMVENFAFRHPSLQMLFMKYCSLSFRKIQNQAFAGSPQLFYLLLSHNQAPSNPGESFAEIFGSIPNLRELFLARTGIRTITRKTFNRFSNLTRLYLDRNKLTDLPDGAFDDLKFLEELVLSSNELETVRESAFNLDTRNRLHHLDMWGNKFKCDCDILWFQQFFLDSQYLFKRSRKKYLCNNDPRFPLASLVLNEQSCFFSQSTYKFMSATITILIIVCTLTSITFKYRWHFRLCWYEAFKGRDAAARYRRLQEGNFDYDVFVSYASEDLPWIRSHLLPELEDRLGLKLCIHERDFLLGPSIADNIVDSVQSSKKILMVFSRSFVTNQWCQFQLAFCLRHVMDHDDALIVTSLGPMTALRSTAIMLAVLTTTPCIEWESSPQAVAAFWGRIHLALADILPRNRL